MFLSFEGIDCCGKTTQIKLLTEKLNEINLRPLLIREPGGTEISESIRDILLDKKNNNMTQVTELLLFSASRAQLVTEIIKPAILQNKIIICDRFVDSTTVYQGYGRGLRLNAVKAINQVATMGVLPKKTFFIDITVQEMYQRRSVSNQDKDRMEMNSEEFYNRVRDGYHTLVKEEPDRFVLIDGKQSMDHVHEVIWKSVYDLLPTHE
jgi:dTMP kinase